MEKGKAYETRITVMLKEDSKADVVTSTDFTEITPVSKAFFEADGAINLTGFATTIAAMIYTLAF